MGSKLVRAQVLNGVLTKTIKLTRRPRPGEATNVAVGSLPSGHTSTAAANATVVWRELGWKAGLPAAILAGYIGASRLDQWHYLSDVALGATIGIASGLAVDSESDGSFSIAPAVGPGVYGITLSFGRKPFSPIFPGEPVNDRYQQLPWTMPIGIIEIEYDGRVW